MNSYQVNSKRMPQNFPREFDAHIYFDESTASVAQLLQQKMKQHFADKEVFVGDLIPKAIGPHPIPMFEANFPEKLFGEVVLWLMRERGTLNVLVHPLSGNDLLDHTGGAIWLGQSLALKLEIF